MSPKLLVKLLLHSVFYADNLKHQAVNKTAFRSCSANPHKLCTH